MQADPGAPAHTNTYPHLHACTCACAQIGVTHAGIFSWETREHSGVEQTLSPSSHSLFSLLNDISPEAWEAGTCRQTSLVRAAPEGPWQAPDVTRLPLSRGRGDCRRVSSAPSIWVNSGEATPFQAFLVLPKERFLGADFLSHENNRVPNRLVCFFGSQRGGRPPPQGGACRPVTTRPPPGHHRGRSETEAGSGSGGSGQIRAASSASMHVCAVR